MINRQKVNALIEEIGVMPSIRVSSSEDASFVAQTIAEAGIPIVEITMTVPGALDLVRHLLDADPQMIVGAGTVLTVEAARECLDAGARFITSTGLDLEVVRASIDAGVSVFPGVLTPTEAIMAWRAGADMVKVFPCSLAGGPAYIRALKAPLPQVPMIAAGGVTQQTVADFINAGATAVGVGSALIPAEAIRKRQGHRIAELARRFQAMVRGARNHGLHGG